MFAACVCKVTFKHLPRPFRSHMQSFIILPKPMFPPKMANTYWWETDFFYFPPKKRMVQGEGGVYFLFFWVTTMTPCNWRLLLIVQLSMSSVQACFRTFPYLFVFTVSIFNVENGFCVHRLTFYGHQVKLCFGRKELHLGIYNAMNGWTWFGQTIM